MNSSAKANVTVQIFDAVRLLLGTDVQPAYIMIDDAPAEISAVQQCEWGKHGAVVALCNWCGPRR
jgi:hypothetical protein